jgi:hypothetical protein
LVCRIHRDPNFIAILQEKARWPFDENGVADRQRTGTLSVDGPVIARTTKLYNRTKDGITLSEVGRIRL